MEQGLTDEAGDPGDQDMLARQRPRDVAHQRSLRTGRRVKPNPFLLRAVQPRLTGRAETARAEAPQA